MVNLVEPLHLVVGLWVKPGEPPAFQSGVLNAEGG
jgi:hypothetical protein